MIGKDIKKSTSDRDEFVTKWMDELQRGIKRRRQEEKRWELNESFEDLKQWDGELGSGDEVTINKLGSYIRNYRAKVSYNEPRCKLTPKTADGWAPIDVPVVGPGGTPKMNEMGQVVTRQVIPAEAREALINDILSAPMQNLQQTSGLLTKAGILGYGVLKTGYRPIFESDPSSDDEQMIPIVDGKLDLSAFERNKIDGSLIDDDNGRLVERKMIPLWEDFIVKFIPYRNMIIDPDGGNYWDDHRWVAEEEIRDLDDVKEDKLFSNTEELKASGVSPDNYDANIKFDYSGSDWGSSSEDPDKSDRKIVRLFHLYDMKRRRYYVFADGHGKALRDVPWSELKIVDHPYADFRPSQIIGEFYQRPIASDLAPINQFYNLARKYELRAMQRSSRKAFTRKGTMDGGNLEQFTNDEDMAIIELDMPKHQPLSDAIMPFTPPPVSEALYINSQKIASDFAEVGGMTDEARGKASADTATQVNAMEAHNAGRLDHDRKILAETWRRCFKKLNDSIDANMTQPRAILVQGTDGQAFQAMVDPDMIAGDFDVSVDFEDMAPTNSAVQSAGRVQIAQIAGQAPHLFMSEPLVKGWLEPFGIKDQNFIDALVQASQMQMQMLMMQGAQAPGPVPEAGPPENEADAISQTGAGTQSPRMQGAS